MTATAARGISLATSTPVLNGFATYSETKAPVSAPAQRYPDYYGDRAAARKTSSL